MLTLGCDGGSVRRDGGAWERSRASTAGGCSHKPNSALWTQRVSMNINFAQCQRSLAAPHTSRGPAPSLLRTQGCWVGTWYGCRGGRAVCVSSARTTHQPAHTQHGGACHVASHRNSGVGVCVRARQRRCCVRAHARMVCRSCTSSRMCTHTCVSERLMCVCAYGVAGFRIPHGHIVTTARPHNTSHTHAQAHLDAERRHNERKEDAGDERHTPGDVAGRGHAAHDPPLGTSRGCSSHTAPTPVSGACAVTRVWKCVCASLSRRDHRVGRRLQQQEDQTHTN